MPTRTATASRRRLMSLLAGASAVALSASGFALGAAPSSASVTPSDDGHGLTGHDCLAAIAPGAASHARQRAFDAASRTYGVPVAVLLGVSYLESRWDDHGRSPSTSGGYGPMHLTDVTVEKAGDARGLGTFNTSTGPASLHTVKVAAGLTGLPARRLISDDAANICAGAALLASGQRELGRPVGRSTSASGWYDAVAAYSGSADPTDARIFASRVLRTIATGAMRTTNDGQRVGVSAHPGLRVPPPRSAKSAGANGHLDCPKKLDCEWIPAPYEKYGTGAGDYGNHDVANREQDLSIDYIVIHDTEASYATTLQLVQDPTYVSWNYSIRSSDGHVAQHLDAKDVGWHAGNWYVNSHSIGIEHEGFAAQGATWYTESLYESSAALVKYLAKEYSVPLDRAHIIGHDQVPGVTPAYVKGMHWDPGPFWNWEHYFALLGKPIAKGKAVRGGHGKATASYKKDDVVTVAPGFADNQQTVTGCSSAGEPCPPQGANFVYLHTQPHESSPLVSDVGLHPDGSPSTTNVSDIGARVAAGQKLVVADQSGDWLGVWYLGQLGWLESPPHHPTVVPSKGQVVTAKPGVAEVPVYGRAYPEQSAYDGTAVPPQTVAPLQYTIKAGQAYVLADDSVPTDYYYAKTFDDSIPDDHTVITGQDGYDEIWFGHRMFFVRTADIDVS